MWVLANFNFSNDYINQSKRFGLQSNNPVHVSILDKREKNILVNMPTKFRKLARTGSKDDEFALVKFPHRLCDIV